MHDTAIPRCNRGHYEAKNMTHDSRILELAARHRAMESELNDAHHESAFERLALARLESKTKSRR